MTNKLQRRYAYLAVISNKVSRQVPNYFIKNYSDNFDMVFNNITLSSNEINKRSKIGSLTVPVGLEILFLSNVLFLPYDIDNKIIMEGTLDIISERATGGEVKRVFTLKIKSNEINGEFKGKKVHLYPGDLIILLFTSKTHKIDENKSFFRMILNIQKVEAEL